jgi:acid stress-induced BolA-like protein IbaG/YrbA
MFRYRGANIRELLYSETNIKLLHVSAPGCHYQGVITSRSKYETYTFRHRGAIIRELLHPEAIIKLLHVSAPGCHYQEVMQNKEVTRPTANVGIVSPLLK